MRASIVVATLFSLAGRGGAEEPVHAQPDAPAAAPVAAPAELRPTLQELFAPPRLLGVRPSGLRLSADGALVLWRWSATDAEQPKLGWWIAPTDGSAKARELFPAEPQVELEWGPSGTQLFLFRAGWIERFDIASGASEPLFECGANRGRLTFTRDGRHVLFTAGPDDELWAVDVASGTRFTPAHALQQRGRWFQLLEETGEVVLFAAPPGPDGAPLAPPLTAAGPATAGPAAAAPAKEGDAARAAPPKKVLWRVALPWLGAAKPPRATALQEAGRVELSADGRFAVVTNREFEQRRQLILADYLAEAVKAVPVRGDLAGDPPPKASIALFDVERGVALPLPLDEGERFAQVESDWSPSGARLLVSRVSGDFKVRQLLVADPDAQKSWPLFAERDAAWIGGPLQHASWRADGKAVLFSSEQEGHCRLYLVAPEGGPLRPLTAAGSEVQELRVVANRPLAYAVSNLRDPAERSLLALDLETGSARELATPVQGCVGDFAVSADGSRIAFLFERLGVPGDVHAIATAPGATPVVLSDTVPAALRELALPTPDVVTFANPDDGTSLRALLYRPTVAAGGDGKFPAVLFVHGAGYLQNVTRSMTEYPANYLFHQRLARMGFVVLDVDYRHSAGYGRKFRTDIHGFMGGKDLDDEVAGARWLAAQGFVDPARIGLYGGSYGGFLTLMALFTKPDLFACGAALRSVTDWRTYNTWYTTPRLGDPKADAENYRRSSPIEHAAGLTKPLLILHGLKDSNVFAQDSIRLIEKLIQLGKEFDAMLYPSQDHGFTDPESWIDEYRRIERLFVRELRPPGDAATATATAAVSSASG